MTTGRILRGLLTLASLAFGAARVLASDAAFVKNIGTASHATGAVSSLAINAAGGVAAGNSVIVALVVSPLAGPIGCADTKGNSYAVNADRANTHGGRVVICSAHAVAGLSDTDVITVSFPSSSTGAAASASEFSGLSAAPFDQTSSATGNSPSPSSGSTAATSQPAELLLGAIWFSGTNAAAMTSPGAGYALTNPVMTSGKKLISEYAIVSASGPYQAGATLSTANQWTAVLATFRASDTATTGTPTASPTGAATNTATATRTATASPQMTSTRTATATKTRTPTRTPSMTRTATPTRTASRTPTVTPTRTPTRTPTPTRTLTASTTPTSTSTPTPTRTSTPSPPPTPAATPTPTPTLSGFVTRTGTTLSLEGQPYTFAGLNVYGAVQAPCWSQESLDEGLTRIGSANNASRVFAFQRTATTNGVRDWSYMDAALATFRAHGFKVIMTLTDNWAGQPCTDSLADRNLAWYQSGYRTTVDYQGATTYRDWVAQVVARYKDDPTILAWQLVNEGEARINPSDPCNATAENAAATALRAFADDVGGLVKSIDQNHLVSLGTISGECGSNEDHYRFIHASPMIDLCDYHDYLFANSPMGNTDSFNGLQVSIDRCHAIGKPLMVAETGIHYLSEINPPTRERRATLFDAKFSAQFAAGAVGELVWTWALYFDSRFDYQVSPGDPTLNVLATYRPARKRESAPAVTATPTARP